MEFDKRLREERVKCSMTQKELADRAGVAPSTISSYENGGKIPPLDIAARLADALNVSIGSLCGQADPTPTRNQTYSTFADFAKAFLAMREVGITVCGQHEQTEKDPPVMDWELENYQFRAEDGTEEYTPVLWADFSIRNTALAEFLDTLGSMQKLVDKGSVPQEVLDAWIEKSLSSLELRNTGLDPEVLQWYDSIGRKVYPYKKKRGKLSEQIEQ